MNSRRVAVSARSVAADSRCTMQHLQGGRWLPIVTRRDVLTVLSDVGTLGDAGPPRRAPDPRHQELGARHDPPVGHVGRWKVYALSTIEAWAESSDRIA